MKGQGKNVFASSQETGGAIALMHIAIDDQHTPRIAFCHKAIRGDGEIVEDAVAGARIMQRVMAARCAISGKTVLHGKFGSEPCPAIGVPHTVGDMRSYGEADASFLLAGDIGGEDLLDIIRAMDGFQPASRHRMWRMFCNGEAAVPQRRHDKLIFVEFEGAASGWRGHVIGVVNDVEQASRRDTICRACIDHVGFNLGRLGFDQRHDMIEHVCAFDMMIGHAR